MSREDSFSTQSDNGDLLSSLSQRSFGEYVLLNPLPDLSLTFGISINTNPDRNQSGMFFVKAWTVRQDGGLFHSRRWSERRRNGGAERDRTRCESKPTVGLSIRPLS
ncbi:MAG: hypothetical protein FJ130_07430 [Deltaproteobacteria bacterium]|nr:hypothetical protein [Deltaproteobacteria bacterium]